jgi:hypothetical protein
LGAAAGPIALVVALGMSMAAANNKTVDEVVTQTSNDRVKTANEAGSLLASEQNLSNEQDAEKQKANGK